MRLYLAQLVCEPSAWPQSLSGGSTHSPALNLRMPQAEFDAFDQLARRRGVKRSTLARQVLEDYLAEHLGAGLILPGLYRLGAKTRSACYPVRVLADPDAERELVRGSGERF
jgi:hypothetical protein